MDSGFKEIKNDDTPLYGPPKILFCGFGAPLQPKLLALMEAAGLTGVPAAFLHAQDLPLTLGDLFKKGDAEGLGEESSLPRAILVAGISQGQLKSFMAAARGSGMKPLWAVLTETSERWRLKDLLEELGREREAMIAWEKARQTQKMKEQEE